MNTTVQFAVGQTWQKRTTLPGTYRITISRLARRTVFGPIEIAGIPARFDGQIRYTQLQAKWDLVETRP